MLLYPSFWLKRSIISYLLLPFSFFYLFCSYIRKICAREHKFSAKVICVGNDVVGGSGKTQLIMWLADYFSSISVNYLIVTKGYGGVLDKAVIVDPYIHNVDLVGDEAYMLARKYKVVAGRDISSVCSLLTSLNLSPGVMIFDDGLQNPYFYKDFKISVIDGYRGYGNLFPIPAGPMRCYVENINSDLYLIIGKDLKNISNLLPDDKLFTAKTTALVDLDLSSRYYAFAGIGNPDKFFDLLIDNGVDLFKKRIFPDHHNYSEKEILSILDEAALASVKIITTAKDYVKIPDIYKRFVICFDVGLLIDNRDLFLKRILI